jgi:signal transduction histidine kinase
VTRRRIASLSLASLGLMLGLVIEYAFYDPTLGVGLAAADFVVGGVLLLSGTVAWDRRPRSGVGPVMIAGGIAWFAGNVSALAVYLHRGPLVQLVLSYPQGRPRGRLAVLVVTAAYVDGLIEPVGRRDRLTLVLAAAVALAAVHRFVRSAGPARRAGAPALVCALTFAATLALAAGSRLAGAGHRDAVLVVYDAAVASIAIVLLVELMRGRWTERTVSGLVVDLGARVDTQGLQALLARALADPSLELGYRLPENGNLVDERGRPLVLPVPGSGRTVTRLEEQGDEIGVLVHDDAVLADPVLIRSVAAAAQLALATARLQAEARARAADVELSRRRIVESTDRQRLRLEGELRGGPELLLERSLARLAEAREGAPDGAASAIAALEAGLRQARVELHAFAQGIRPTALSEGGLMPALALLAAQVPLEVEIDGTVARLPEPIEATLYFVCSEVLANAVKHAHASRVDITVLPAPAAIAVVVADDGIGGASLAVGRGLRGLADRLEALGGRLTVESPSRGGTRVRADLPLPVSRP